MRILAFDCAGGHCAAALVSGERVVAAARVMVERGHAQILLPMLCDLVSDANLTFGEIDRYAVTTGPGSFTGIRVALAAAHGLSLATAAPVIGLTVLDVYAAGAVAAGFDTGRLLIVVESKRLDCFAQIFDREGVAVGQAASVAPDQLATWAGPGRLTIGGDAAARIAENFPGAAVITGSDGALGADPVMLARMAATAIAGPLPRPFYLRPPDAAPARVQ